MLRAVVDDLLDAIDVARRCPGSDDIIHPLDVELVEAAISDAVFQDFVDDERALVEPVSEDLLGRSPREVEWSST